MSTKDTILQSLKEAMRARDQKKLDALRLISSAIKQIEVDERIDVDDARMLIILDKLSKQRDESISQFRAAGRDDLVEQEEFERTIINQFLPEPLSDTEISALVEQAFISTSASKISDMGKVMAILKPQLQGRADIGHVSSMIKARLS